jgi:hypothetical protein
VQIIIAGLATWQIVEIWHHSLLMSSLRARTEMWDNKLGELLVCPFCLSVWVGWFTLAILEFANSGLAGLVFGLIVKGFAVSRLANLGNDVFKQYCRTPSTTDLIE